MTKSSFQQFVLAAGMLGFATAGFAQTRQNPADGPWAGSIQCQLYVEQQGYTRSEIQTWTLASNAPTRKNGDMRIYPATWAATGRGAFQRPMGARASLAQWNINVPPISATIAMFIRASDQQFIIRVWDRPAPSSVGVTAMRQMAESGVTQVPTKLNPYVYEWSLPWIPAKPEDVSEGKLTVPTESLGADLTPVGATPTAECTYRFSRKANGSNTAVVDNPVIQPASPSEGRTARGDMAPVPGGNPVSLVPGAAPTGEISKGATSASPTISSDSAGPPQLPAAIASITPNSAGQGAKGLQATVLGISTNFAPGSTQIDFGPGIQVLDLKVTSPTNAIATLNVDPAASLGPRSVTLVTGKEAVASQSGFSVTMTLTSTPLLLTPSMPTITQLNPNSAPQESAGLTVTLTGFATHFAANSTVADFGPGVTVTRLTVDSPTQATALVNVDATASTTARTVTLKTGTETAALSGGFSVTVPPPPSITDVNPNSAEPGETNLSITVDAVSTHFAAGTTLDLGPGVTVTSLIANSKTRATAVLSIAAGATLSSRAVTATTGTEIAKTNFPMFTVTSNPGQLLQVSPSQAPQQQPFQIHLVGNGTHFSRASTVSISVLCQFEGVTDVARTHLTAHMFCPRTSPTGSFGVSVSSNGHTVGLSNAFTLTPEPDIYGHSLVTASSFGILQSGATQNISGLLATLLDSNWFYFTFASTTELVFTLKDVLPPSNYALDAFSASSSHLRVGGVYQPGNNGYKTLTLKDDGSHGVFVQVHADNWDARVPKFTLNIQSVYSPPPFIPQTQPDSFSFSDQRLAIPLMKYESGSRKITGINVGVPISIPSGNGEYSINGGAFISSSGTVYAGDYVTLRGQLDVLDGSRVILLKVGDYSTSWYITRLP